MKKYMFFTSFLFFLLFLSGCEKKPPQEKITQEMWKTKLLY